MFVGKIYADGLETTASVVRRGRIEEMKLIVYKVANGQILTQKN